MFFSPGNLMWIYPVLKKLKIEKMGSKRVQICWKKKREKLKILKPTQHIIVYC